MHLPSSANSLESLRFSWLSAPQKSRSVNKELGILPSALLIYLPLIFSTTEKDEPGIQLAEPIPFPVSLLSFVQSVIHLTMFVWFCYRHRRRHLKREGRRHCPGRYQNSHTLEIRYSSAPLRLLLLSMYIPLFVHGDNGKDGRICCASL